MKYDAKYPGGRTGGDSGPSEGNKSTRNWTPYLIGGILGLLLVILGMTNCWFGHTWNAATCTLPKTCAACGKTEGSAAGHNYLAATANSPKMCSICGHTVGTVESQSQSHTHTWVDATCTAPKHCVDCGQTVGTEAPHQWMDATYDTPMTCRNCGATSGAPKKEEPSGGQNAPQQEPENEFGDLRVGSTVFFGEYEQDNNKNNGKESIEWIVLDKSGDCVMLMSRYALDCKPYHSYTDEVTWEDCSLRNWLNSGFYNSAFSSSEQRRIQTTKVYADKNPDFTKVDPGDATNDKVFLLSVSEAMGYYPNYQDRACQATAYAQAQGAFVRASNNGSWWWLRTPGSSLDTAASIDSNGSSDTDGGDVASTKGTVRPVIWISIG